MNGQVIINNPNSEQLEVLIRRIEQLTSTLEGLTDEINELKIVVRNHNEDVSRQVRVTDTE